MQKQHNTVITDAEGVEHEYTTIAFPAGEGADLLLEITEILGGPMSRIGLGLMSLSQEGGESKGLPEALTELPRMIAQKGGQKLIRRILRTTKRKDGKDWQSLGTDHLFDSVYASNYIEMFQAIGWVVQVNFLPFLTGNSTGLKGLLSWLSQWLPISPIPSERPSENG